MNFRLRRSVLPWLRRWFGDSEEVLGTAGLAFTADGVALAVVDWSEGGAGRLQCAVKLPGDPAGFGELVMQLAERYGLQHYRVNAVLAPADYRLAPTTAPEVPPQEMRGALRWRIHEALDFPVEEAEIEYFAMPAPRHAGSASSVMVAAASSKAIQRYEKWMADAELRLAAIDIPELALRDMAALLPESQRGVVFLALRETAGIVQVQKDEVVYVTRSIEIGMRHLRATSPQEESWNSSAMGRLALEIQRSMDYFESHYGMPPVAGVVLAPVASGSQELADRLAQSLGVLCRVMDVSALVPCAERLDDGTQQACLLALGAALSYPESAA